MARLLPAIDPRLMTDAEPLAFNNGYAAYGKQETKYVDVGLA